MEEFKPGQVIEPQRIPAAPTEPSPAPDTAAPQTPVISDPAPAAAPEVPGPGEADEQSAPPATSEATDDTAGWQYAPEVADSGVPERPELPAELSWTASEFVAHDKGGGWYGLLAVGGAGVAAAVYFLTHDVISTGIVIFAALVFGIFAARKPRTQAYRLTTGGIQVGSKQYDFHAFKTFSVTEEADIANIVFMPLKRFMPPLTIYVAPDMEDQVVNFLSAILPFEQRSTDAVDSFLRRIRF